MAGETARGAGLGEPGPYDPLTSLLILTAKIETQLQGLTDQKRAEHERLSMEIARVERDAGRDIAEVKADQARLAEVVQSLRLSWAKAAGIASVVAVVLSTALTVLVNRLMGGMP